MKISYLTEILAGLFLLFFFFSLDQKVHEAATTFTSIPRCRVA